MKKNYSKKKATSPKSKAIFLEVTPEQYQAKLARGIAPSEMLPPGRHQFKRGGFLKHLGITREELSAAGVKVGISIYLDSDVLEYFKQRAAAPDALPYQTQINNELRAIMQMDKSAGDASAWVKQELLNDDQFIGALASRLQAQERRRTS